MYTWLRHIRLVLVAGTALALSAGLAFAATPPSASNGLANAAAHAGKTVPVAGGDQTAGEDETTETTETSETTESSDTSETTESTETETTESDTTETDTTETETADQSETADAGGNCTTDPTTATPEELGAMNHGAIVCWAAQQVEWPAWFSNHGAFVRCWAHQGKVDAVSCTEDPATVQPTGDQTSGDGATGDQVPAVHGKGHGHGHGKAFGKLRHHG
jgi:hypothetical protein